MFFFLFDVKQIVRLRTIEPEEQQIVKISLIAISTVDNYAVFSQKKIARRLFLFLNKCPAMKYLNKDFLHVV